MRKILSMAFVVVLCVAALAGVQAASAEPVQNGWNAEKTQYYKDGVAQTGPMKIGKKWYAFTSKGNRATRAFKYHGQKLFCNEQGYLEARSEGGELMYANGKAMSSADAADYKCVNKARKIVKKITKPSQTKAQKLRICFDWVMKKYYGIHRSFPYTSNWPSTYAMDHFNNRNGDCHSDAAAFAYLAYACGYTKVYACTDCRSGDKIGGHAWAEVNGLVYDPLFAQAKSYSKYYACRYGVYYATKPATHVKIPYYNPKNAGKGTEVVSSSRGLVKKSGNYYFVKDDGKKLKNSWKKVGKYKYYFGSKGKAFIGCKQVGKTYYVFNAKARLSVGSGDHFITVKGVKYRVTKAGKAKTGWNSTNTKRYYRGVLQTGNWVWGGSFYAFEADGTYNTAKTSQVRTMLSKMIAEYKANALEVTDLTELTALIGQPKNTIYMDSCSTVTHNGAAVAGKDGIWEYGQFNVYTFKAKDGIEYVTSFEAA